MGGGISAAAPFFDCDPVALVGALVKKGTEEW
jgi:hypothetical protein